MKIQKWHKKFKIRLANLLFKCAMKLNPCHPVLPTISIRRPYHLKRMIISSIMDYELITRHKIDPDVIQGEWIRQAMDDLSHEMVRNGLVYFHLEQDEILRKPYLIAEVDVLETGKSNNYVDNTDLFKQ